MNQFLKDYLVFLIEKLPLDLFEKELIPFMEREKNEDTLKIFIDYLNEAIETSNICLEDTTISEKDKNDLINLLNFYTSKKNIIINLMNEYDAKTKSDIEKDIKGEKSLVLFAKGKNGKILAKKDLDAILKDHNETFNQLVKLINDLFNGTTSNMVESKDFNIQKQRQFSGNSNLKGIFELKDLPVRLMYMREASCIVIIGALIKKVQSNSIYVKTVLNMKDRSYQYRTALEQGNLNIEQELQDSYDYLNELNKLIIKKEKRD